MIYLLQESAGGEDGVVSGRLSETLAGGLFLEPAGDWSYPSYRQFPHDLFGPAAVRPASTRTTE